MSPAAGGPTEVIRMLVHFAPPGFESEIATTDAPDAPWLRELPVPAHGLGGPVKRWYAPRLLPWLRANRHRFDGVIVHGLWEYTGVAARLAFDGHVPRLVFPHGMLDPYFKRRFPLKHLKKLPFWLVAEYWNLRRATRVLFTTELERDLAAESFALHRWNPMVVALGTEAPPAETGRLLEAFYEHCPELAPAHDGGAAARFLLYLGRIHPKKGADLLLDAFALGEHPVAAEAPDLHLVMAGPGAGPDDEPFGRELRARVEASPFAARVHWPGMLRGDTKWGAFAASEAFILPSHQENFGIAVVESLASRRPVLITQPVNIAPEIAADNAGLVGEDTAGGIRNLLERWLALTPAEREAMAAQALESFRTRYDMRRNTAKILGLFERRSQPESQARSQPNATA